MNPLDVLGLPVGMIDEMRAVLVEEQRAQRRAQRRRR
jgi:hypothetical protein